MKAAVILIGIALNLDTNLGRMILRILTVPIQEHVLSPVYLYH